MVRWKGIPIMPISLGGATSKTKLERIEKPWLFLRAFITDPFLVNTPEHYKKFFWDWKYGPKTPVHYIPREEKFERDPKDFYKHNMIHVENVPLPLLTPHECSNMIMGGEMIVKGLTQKRKLVRRMPMYWFPNLVRTVYYSEILDKKFDVDTTHRAIDLVHEHYGLDGYILETSAADLGTDLPLKLRRSMLLALIDKSLYPDNPGKKEEIYKKYKHHIIPRDEADWYGLNLFEASLKQELLDEENNRPIPLKEHYRKHFIQVLSDVRENQIKKSAETPNT